MFASCEKKQGFFVRQDHRRHFTPKLTWYLKYSYLVQVCYCDCADSTCFLCFSTNKILTVSCVYFVATTKVKKYIIKSFFVIKKLYKGLKIKCLLLQKIDKKKITNYAFILAEMALSRKVYVENVDHKIRKVGTQFYVVVAF